MNNDILLSTIALCVSIMSLFIAISTKYNSYENWLARRYKKIEKNKMKLINKLETFITKENLKLNVKNPRTNYIIINGNLKNNMIYHFINNSYLSIDIANFSNFELEKIESFLKNTFDEKKFFVL